MRSKGRGPTLVESYLRRVGIGSMRDRNAFREELGKAHGLMGERVAAAISAREAGEDVDVYILKNATLALSVAVTSQYCSQMYTEFLRWFLGRRFPAPHTVLDVGCDNGVLTCFYATAYPEAQVVGIDRCAEGIACARELARRLNLANVRFEIRDLLDLGVMFPDGCFDLIVSSTVFHEVLEIPENVSEGEDAGSVQAVTGLAGLLRWETGIWVSMERWPDEATLAWWIRVLSRAGLTVVADHSALVTFSDVDGEQETLPLIVATRRRYPPVTPDADMLASQVYRNVHA